MVVANTEWPSDQVNHPHVRERTPPISCYAMMGLVMCDRPSDLPRLHKLPRGVGGGASILPNWPKWLVGQY
jgi:hypothetical protein